MHIFREVQKKIESSIQKIEKAGNLTADVKSSLQVARCKEEIEFIVGLIMIYFM